MRLQLDSSPIGTGNVGGTAPAEPTGHSARSGGASAPGTQDSSSVSGISSLLNDLSTQRAARIQQLTGLVQSGSYNVSSTAISHSLVGQAIR
jgi:anti-sigma28 factor (negative regulator of flagellin synthesis)